MKLTVMQVDDRGGGGGLAHWTTARVVPLSSIEAIHTRVSTKNNVSHMHGRFFLSFYAILPFVPLIFA